jgi:HD-GYP domain-containing protein (c-di-GMP phosphodiesterase class II)
VGLIAVEIAREMGLQVDDHSDLHLTGLLHDIGEIDIRDEILKKSTLFSESKYMIYNVRIGHRVLSGPHAIAYFLSGVLYHHERYDGQGHPEGLRWDSIPLTARIIAVADS